MKLEGGDEMVNCTTHVLRNIINITNTQPMENHENQINA